MNIFKKKCQHDYVLIDKTFMPSAQQIAVNGELNGQGDPTKFLKQVIIYVFKCPKCNDLLIKKESNFP